MKIILCGKGGCGKSTVAALLAREFSNREKKVLVIDTDESNYGLHRQLGLELPEDFLHLFGGKDAFGNRDNSVPVFDKRWTVDDIPEKYVSRQGAVTLMSIGKIHEAEEGCACSMGTLARCFLENLDVRENEVVITDTEAGVEHFGRGVDRFADIIIHVMDPSYESLKLSNKISGMGKMMERPVFFILNKTDAENEAYIKDQMVCPKNVLAVIRPERRLMEDGLKGIMINYSLPEIAAAADRLQQL